MQRRRRHFQRTAVAHIRQQPDDALHDIVFMNHDQRWQISPQEPPRAVSRGDTHPAGSQRFDHFQGTPANSPVRIDRQRTIFEIRLYIFGEVEDRHTWLLKAGVSFCRVTRVNTPKNPQLNRRDPGLYDRVSGFEKLDDPCKIRGVSKRTNEEDGAIRG